MLPSLWNFGHQGHQAGVRLTCLPDLCSCRRFTQELAEKSCAYLTSSMCCPNELSTHDERALQAKLKVPHGQRVEHQTESMSHGLTLRLFMRSDHFLSSLRYSQVHASEPRLRASLGT